MLTRRTILGTVPGLAVAAAVGVSLPAAAQASPQSSTGQSPIDIQPVITRPLTGAPLEVDYAVTDATFIYASQGDCGSRKSEETVQVRVPAGAGTARVGTREYQLEQFHFHTPSEHTLNGREFDAEQHFVHRAADGELLVIGLWLRGSGRARPVDDVLARLPEECGTPIPLARLNLRALLPEHLPVFRYSGSLTTDPYTEGVRWNVVTTPSRASRASLARLRSLFPASNSRETQPVTGREIRLALPI